MGRTSFGPASGGRIGWHDPQSVDGKRILISAEELTGGLAAVRALRSAGYEPWAALTRPQRLVAHSRALGGVITAPDPSIDAEGFARRLASAADELSIAAVLPGSEDALLALAGTEHLFGSRIAIGICASEPLERSLDKRQVTRLAAAAGLPTPPTTEADGAELRAQRRELTYPLMLKPERTKVHGPDGVLRREPAHRVRSERELESVLASATVRTWLLQPCIPGSLAAVCGVAWKGELVCALHQSARRIWPPDCGISSYAETVAPNAAREEALGRLLALTGCSGIFQAQFLRAGDEWVFIDLNPRVYGSLALAVAAGLNLPAIWVDLLLGAAPALGSYRIGVRYRAEGNEMRWIAHNLRHGRLAAAVSALVPRRRTVHALFSIRDPLPAVAGVLGVLPR